MQGGREKNYPFKQSVEKREEEEVFVFFYSQYICE